MAKGHEQPDKRYQDVWLDQHGREYNVNCERATNDPIDIAPASNWRAPIEPAWARAQNMFAPPLDDSAVVKLVPVKERARKGHQIQIDYRAWLLKIDQAYANRQAHIVAIAQESFKGADLLKVMEGNVPAELLRYVGPEPMPPREVILAMEAGNAWALGKSDVVPEAAKPFLERMRFAIEARRTGAVATDPVADPFAVAGANDADDREPEPYVEDPFGPGGASPLGEEPELAGVAAAPAKSGRRRG